MGWTHVEKGQSDHEGEAEMKHYGLTAAPPALLGGRR